MVQPVIKDLPWEELKLVFIHMWSLITGSFMQKMSNWYVKCVVAIDSELLNKGGLKHRFDCCSILRKWFE